MTKTPSKLELRGGRVDVEARHVTTLIAEIFNRLGCPEDHSTAIAEHLVDANLCGMESHGVMRVMQYAERMRSGEMKIDVRPEVRKTETGATVVDGFMGSGIPVMALAYDTAIAQTGQNGLGAVSVLNTGHTGRHGAYAEKAAEQGFLTICTGGGNRQVYGMVAPHGGAKGMLPTNP